MQVKSAEIEKALSASAEASRELDRQRDVYRPFASAGSKLFFLIQVCSTTLRPFVYHISPQPSASMVSILSPSYWLSEAPFPQ